MVCLALLSLVLFWAGTTFAATNSVPSKELLPQQLELFWGGLPGLNTCSVQWDGKSLAYEQTYRAKKTKADINPSDQQWQRFWKQMDEVNVWSWQKRYDNPDVMDGMVWHVKMGLGTNRVETYGSNAYPGNTETNRSDINPSKLFMQYQAAVEELIGRKLWAH